MTTFHERYEQWCSDRNIVNHTMRSARKLEELNGRAADLLHQASARCDIARIQLSEVAESWGDGPCPGFTCTEAETFYEVLQLLEVDERITERFMMSHAWTDDDPDDLHSPIEDADGCLIGWARRDPDADQ